MDQSRGSYLLCFPDFPCKSFKLKDFRPPAPYLVDSKRSRRRGVLFMFYDVHIPRCAHIKTNGTQCGSPALREQRYCFFHEKWQRQQITLKTEPPPHQTIGQATNQITGQTTGQTASQTTNDQPGFTLPLLEDADSVQVALMQVIQ